MIKGMIVTVCGVLALGGVARADIADREHDDSNTAQVVQAIQNLSDRIEALQAQLSVVNTTVNEMPVGGPAVECPEYSAPTTFRLYRSTKTGKLKARRFILKAE